jgi:hypothetical protein
LANIKAAEEKEYLSTHLVNTINTNSYNNKRNVDFGFASYSFDLKNQDVHPGFTDDTANQIIKSKSNRLKLDQRFIFHFLNRPSTVARRCYQILMSFTTI